MNQASRRDPQWIIGQIRSGGALPFIGFAGLMRIAMSGLPLYELGPLLMARLQHTPDDPNLLLDLSTTAYLSAAAENAALAAELQGRALQRCQTYHLPAVPAAALRLLVLMAPGDMTANTPFDCLLENSDIDTTLVYVGGGLPLPATLPEHDLVFVAVGESAANRATLALLHTCLRDWPRPVINLPESIMRLPRDRVAALLATVAGVSMPPTRRVTRAQLQALCAQVIALDALLPDCAFPVIVRPIDSQGGKELERLCAPAEIDGYLDRVAGDDFFIAQFVDYSHPGDGLFRKYRIAWIDGAPFACHMAVSSHWMIHYVNAHMDEDAAKRAEEERFMRGFDTDFAPRHAAALAAIHESAGLDYFAIDCAETRDGALLVFELDNAMLVHDIDAPGLYPYKSPQMRRIFYAFRAMLRRRALGAATVRA